MIINCFKRMIIFTIVYVIKNIGGKKNSPNSLNVIVNYYYHGENRVIIW